jgi:hypothetical protein
VALSLNREPENTLPYKTKIVFLAFLTYWIFTAGRSTAIYSGGYADERLFFQQALNLMAGNWLGPYNVDTLVKGPIYPVFLALSHFTGLSIGLSQSLLYFLSSLYFALVVSRITHRASLFGALLLALLVCPIMYEQSMQRLLRDPFYCALALCYFASLLDAFFDPGDSRMRLLKSAIAGLIGGLLWMTREEGVWIVPQRLLRCWLR